MGTDPKIVYCKESKEQNTMATPTSHFPPKCNSLGIMSCGQMLSFVNDTNADVDMAYDFVCDQLGIDSSLLITMQHGMTSTTYWEAHRRQS